MEKEHYRYWKRKFREEREKELSYEDHINRSVAVPILVSLITAAITAYLMK